MTNISENATPAIIFKKMKRGHSSDNESGRSALSMLEAIIDVGSHPEKFVEVCDDWGHHSTGLENFKHFDNLLDTVYVQSSTAASVYRNDGVGHDLGPNSPAPPYSIIVDVFFQIQSIGDKAAEALGVGLGDNISELFNVDAETIVNNITTKNKERQTHDIFSVTGSRHVVSVDKEIKSKNGATFYTFSLLKIELPVEAEKYIRTNLALTNAEIEILKLLLERFSVVSISSMRKCTLNTIRTHINNIKKKFKSHSLTDVILSTQEIIALKSRNKGAINEPRTSYVPVQKNSNVSKLPVGTHQVEYSRHGDPRARPLVILHSIEYGIAPPNSFIAEAIRRGYCIYVPIRSGFGRTTPANSVRLSAVILGEFIKSLKLSDVTLVSLSTSAPTAIKLLQLSPRIQRAIFVNYAFDTKNKIDHIKPSWLRGLLKFALGSQDSFKFAFGMTKRMLRIIGYKAFYRRIYHTCDEDLEYLEKHASSFEASANLIMSANAENIRNDLVHSFVSNPTLSPSLIKQKKVVSIFGQHTHGISIEPIRENANLLGIPLYILKNVGRNCIYQSPVDFFQVVDLEGVVQEQISL